MNIIEVQNQLHQCFLKRDTFVYPDQVKEVRVDTHQMSAKNSLVLKVLRLFEEKKMLLSYEEGDKIFFTLFAPLGSEGQQVMISQATAELLAEIVNQYRKAADIEGGLVDKFEINENDIQSLALICTRLMSAMDPDNDEGEDKQ